MLLLQVLAALRATAGGAAAAKTESQGKNATAALKDQSDPTDVHKGETPQLTL